MKFLYCPLFIIVFFIFGTTFGTENLLYSEVNSGSIRGIVKNNKGEILSGANIVITENLIGCSSNIFGRFEISNLEPGEYTLKISYVSCETSIRKVLVLEGKVTELSIQLSQSLFQIGGIEVIGSTELLPNSASTKTIITSGEIEHYQASSIKDVLDLVPGVQKSDNPGLSKKGQIAIRGDFADKLSAFGTLILIDGMPVSNNANLQYETPDGGNLLSISNAMNGVDLRMIPADNIEKIEVITGLPSVRYGDFVGGVININTKTGLQPHRLKIKDNPDTREANLAGSVGILTNGLSYNLNIARSERDIRVDGDEYTRLSAQTGYFNSLLDNALQVNHKLSTQLIFDEEAPEGDLSRTENYNRGYSIGYSGWGNYNFNDQQNSLNFNMFINLEREKSKKSKLVQSDVNILPNGDTVSVYMGKVETRGYEWTLGGKTDWNGIYYSGDIVHKMVVGADIQYNANTGEGLVFDTVYNYYGAASNKRPYNFSSIPGQTLISFYAEDQITGNLFFDFNLSIGARYETYRPFRFNVSGFWGDGDILEAHQGSFFNPRLNLIIFLSSKNQLRISTGKSSKSPAMSLIYPPDEVFKWRDPSTSKVNYFRYDQRSPNLKGISEIQYEIAYDHKISDDIASSVSFYYKERIGETRQYEIPVFFISEHNNKTSVYYIDQYMKQRNSGWSITKGSEIVFKTNRIKSLNMNFQFSGSYNHINGSDGGSKIDMEPDLTKGQYPNNKIQDTLIGFIYGSSGKWSDRIILNYNVKYTLPPLGLWVSLRAEHVIGERVQRYNLEYEDYSILTESGKQRYVFDRKISVKGPKWLFNLSISKSLFKGAEVSFYINNFLDDPAIRRYEVLPGLITEEVRNTALFYGIEFSTIIDEFFK